VIALKRIPPGAYLAATIAALLVPSAVLGILSELDVVDDFPMLFAAALTTVVALAFGIRWGGGWRWGLWISSGLTVLLTLAFVGLSEIGRAEIHPLGQALGITLTACVAAQAGSRLRDWWLARGRRPRRER
jgi:hypothetical protein